jgi:hypothetical protein
VTPRRVKEYKPIGNYTSLTIATVAAQHMSANGQEWRVVPAQSPLRWSIVRIK